MNKNNNKNGVGKCELFVPWPGPCVAGPSGQGGTTIIWSRCPVSQEARPRYVGTTLSRLAADVAHKNKELNWITLNFLVNTVDSVSITDFVFPTLKNKYAHIEIYKKFF
jgi:hypothetical protein